MTNHRPPFSLHLLTGLVLLLFSCLALGSFNLFGGGDYLEQPCTEITPVPTTYTVIIHVRDKVTGDPIPNANLLIQTSTRRCPYLGNGKCKISPGTFNFTQLSETTGQDGNLTLITKEISHATNLDYTTFDIQAGAPNYSNQEVLRELSPELTTITVEIRLINLNTQP